MLPDDRLDALLTSLDEGRLQPADVDPDLLPLVKVARRLSHLDSAAPSPDFASDLHSRLVARTAALQARQADFADVTLPGQSYAPEDMTVPLATRPLGNAPIQRDTWPTLSPGVGVVDRHARRPRRTHRSRLFWQGLAAAVVFLVCGGTFGVAAFAQPGNPLYGLRALESHVGVAVAPTGADRAQQQLNSASAALTTLEGVVTRHSGDAAYTQALAGVRKQEAAASQAVGSLSSSSAYPQLLTQLQGVQARERADLRQALPLVGWENRLATTLALGDLGDTIPRITSASATEATGDGGGSWRVEIHGGGFLPGATLVVNGQPVGTVLSVTQDTLLATIPAGAIAGAPHALGVSNTDGTAAQTDQLGVQTSGDQPTPGPEATPTSGDNGGGGTGGGDHNGTPTPSPRK
ncbi:MAG TPA: hypothetical protein VJN88_10870 [Ktedonobacterales bacterium]|nr:hypothetical protein [Ktedonobacterales bacterium]